MYQSLMQYFAVNIAIQYNIKTLYLMHNLYTTQTYTQYFTLVNKEK